MTEAAEEEIEALREQLLAALSLKRQPRRGWLRAGRQPAPTRTVESVADHSWGVAWLTLALAPPDLDLGRALQLAVVHDLAEAVTGDVLPAEAAALAPGDREREEAAAVEALTGALPPTRRDSVRALAAEYRARETAEARFVKACDRLEMALQAAAYAEESRENGLRREAFSEFVESALRGLDEPSLRALAGAPR